MEAPQPPTPPRSLRPGLPLLLPAAYMLALLLLLLALLAGTALWALRSENGTRWLLPRLPGVQAEGVRGALLSPHFEADRLRVQWDGGRQALTLRQFKGDGLQWSWRPARGAWLGLDARALSAAGVSYDAGPPSNAAARPLSAPASLALPLRLTVDSLHIDELRVGTLAPLRGLQARVALDVDGSHRVEQLRLDWDRLRLQGEARIDTGRPFNVQARLLAAPLQPGDAYAATLQAGGPLDALTLDAVLRGAARAGHAAPQADVHAVVHPFAAWPLGEVQARTEALDLAALFSAAPQTSLSGTVQVQSSARDAPIAASVQLDNNAAGRWNEGRLPLRRLQLALQASLDEPDRLRIRQLELQLGSATQPAGRWTAEGRWSRHSLQLDTTLHDVLPQRLDGRAANVRLSGPLALTLQGLPSPGTAASTAPLSLAIKATLDGRLPSLKQGVRLNIDALADAGHLELRQLRAQAGAALAQATASAQRAGNGSWQFKTNGSLDGFDPRPWWPGDAASIDWGGGQSRLSAAWQFDLQLPATPASLAPLALLQSLAGQGHLHLHDSLLAGVPLALDLTLDQGLQKTAQKTARGAAALEGRLEAELRAGGNTVKVSGRGVPTGAGGDDRLQLDVDAPSLGALGPLFRLMPALRAWAPQAGSVQAGVLAQGRWPLLRTQGQATLKGLEAGALGVANGHAKWQVDTHDGNERPLNLNAELDGLHYGQRRAEQLRAELSGTLSEHHLRVYGALPLAPPPMAEQMLGVNARSGTRALLQAEGQWLAQRGGAGGGRWRGHVTRLAVGSWDGKALPDADAQPLAQWLDARDLRAELQFGADGQLQRVQADAGQLQLAGTAALHWDRIDVELPASGAPDIQFKAEVRPFNVAPLLARLQPTMGWGGDLRVAASVNVHAAERFDADVQIERQDGDLELSDGSGTQLMGLTALSVAVNAHGGTWALSSTVAGRSFGELQGSVNAVTDAARRWPAPDAPLHGTLRADVANLGVWGNWVPAGWRLVGQMRADARVGGRFGAPEYTGSVRGSGLGVRNLLQGVNVSDGALAITLQGTTAQIEHFTLKGGDGTLSLSGGASFGEKPTAQLHLQARQFRLLGRVDRLLIASGNAEMTLQAEQIRLDGKFKVDEGLFDTTRSDAPSLDDDVTVHRAGDAPKSADAGAAPRAQRNVTVAIDVDLGDKLRIRGHGLDTALAGELHISTPGGRLSVQGTVTAERGTYQAYGQKLEIDRGIVAFSGEPGNPRLDILALRPNIDSRVGVSITGNVLTPRVHLYSDTDMSDTDKLSWLVLGRAPDGLGRTDTALLQRAAIALLSGEGEAPSDAFMRTLGIDELSLRQSDGDVHETVISLGKQLSRRWYVGYERGVNATAGTFQLIYRIAQRFTLRAQSGLENAIDVIWVWKFDKLQPPPLPKPVVKPASGGTAKP